MQTISRRLSSTLTLVALALAALLVPAAAPARAAEPKVIVLGFDGADAGLAEQWMNEGKLPNLAKLRDQGTFSPLQSTIPSQTPVSWSTFSTGLNPGRHGIFDFLKRDVATYTPSFAAFDEKSEPFLWGEKTPMIVAAIAALVLALLFLGILKLFRLRTSIAAAVAVVIAIGGGVAAHAAAAKLLPKSRPVAFNRQQGETFWTTLGKAGKRVRVIRIPVTFPPKPFEHGELLSGLGVPDLSGRIGKPFYFTSELFFSPKAGGDFSIEVVELDDNRGTLHTEIKGPENKLFPDQSDYITIPMTLQVAEDRSKLGIDVSGQKLDIRPGAWSDWVHFTFPFNSVIKLHGIGRFRLISLEPEVKLYLSPIMFDPDSLPPGFDITTPPSYVHDITKQVGLFKTIGWAIDTWSITDGTIDEQVFFEDVDNTVKKEEEMLHAELAQADDWDLLIHYFEFTDRVQHIMWRYFDPGHPLYTPEGGAKWGDSILKAYQRMDSIVGDTMAKMPKDATLMVVSDHGFASFRRSMNYNTWLAKNGYMRLTGEDTGRKNLEALFDKGKFFVNVDWSQTKAYYLGLGGIYVNLKGREAHGIVNPGPEYDALVAEIKSKLEAYVDEETGDHPVAHVFTRDEAYGTYDPLLIPDMIPANSRNYRVGWQDSLGGIAPSVVEPNNRVWSADHCSVYPPLVPGILFANHRLATANGSSHGTPYMGDVPATILDLYKVPPAEKLDGRSLWEKTGG